MTTTGKGAGYYWTDFDGKITSRKTRNYMEEFRYNQTVKLYKTDPRRKKEDTIQGVAVDKAINAFEKLYGTQSMPTTAVKLTPSNKFGSAVGHRPVAIVTPFSACCGAKILSNFGSTLSTFKKDIKYYNESYTRNRTGMVVCIINNGQTKLGFDKVLQEAGFHRVFAASNPVHQNETTIYLWAKDYGQKDINKKEGVFKAA